MMLACRTFAALRGARPFSLNDMNTNDALDELDRRIKRQPRERVVIVLTYGSTRARFTRGTGRPAFEIAGPEALRDVLPVFLAHLPKER